MNRRPKFSSTMPSEAAKNARTCVRKWRSPSVRHLQSRRSAPRSTSSTVQKQATAFLYMAQSSRCLIGNIQKRSRLGSFASRSRHHPSVRRPRRRLCAGSTPMHEVVAPDASGSGQLVNARLTSSGSSVEAAAPPRSCEAGGRTCGYFGSEDEGVDSADGGERAAPFAPFASGPAGDAAAAAAPFPSGPLPPRAEGTRTRRPSGGPPLLIAPTGLWGRPRVTGVPLDKKWRRSSLGRGGSGGRAGPEDEREM